MCVFLFLDIFLFKNRADGLTAVAAAVGPEHVVRAEVRVPRIERVVRAERTRPIAAVAARVVQFIVVAIARRREKYRVAVGTFHFVAVYTILGSPRPSAVFA